MSKQNTNPKPFVTEIYKSAKDYCIYHEATLADSIEDCVFRDLREELWDIVSSFNTEEYQQKRLKELKEEVKGFWECGFNALETCSKQEFTKAVALLRSGIQAEAEQTHKKKSLRYLNDVLALFSTLEDINATYSLTPSEYLALLRSFLEIQGGCDLFSQKALGKHFIKSLKKTYKTKIRKTIAKGISLQKARSIYWEIEDQIVTLGSKLKTIQANRATDGFEDYELAEPSEILEGFERKHKKSIQAVFKDYPFNYQPSKLKKLLITLRYARNLFANHLGTKKQREHFVDISLGDKKRGYLGEMALSYADLKLPSVLGSFDEAMFREYLSKTTCEMIKITQRWKHILIKASLTHTEIMQLAAEQVILRHRGAAVHPHEALINPSNIKVRNQIIYAMQCNTDILDLKELSPLRDIALLRGLIRKPQDGFKDYLQEENTKELKHLKTLLFAPL